jgi:hypothetical protein
VPLLPYTCPTAVAVHPQGTLVADSCSGYGLQLVDASGSATVPSVTNGPANGPALRCTVALALAPLPFAPGNPTAVFATEVRKCHASVLYRRSGRPGVHVLRLSGSPGGAWTFTEEVALSSLPFSAELNKADSLSSGPFALSLVVRPLLQPSPLVAIFLCARFYPQGTYSYTSGTGPTTSILSRMGVGPGGAVTPTTFADTSSYWVYPFYFVCDFTADADGAQDVSSAAVQLGRRANGVSIDDGDFPTVADLNSLCELNGYLWATTQTYESLSFASTEDLHPRAGRESAPACEGYYDTVCATLK